MTVTTTIQSIPRFAVAGYLRTARLPLTALERVTGHRRGEQWPPALAYESFEAGVETVVGSVFKDTTLVEQGNLRKAKLAQLREAAELETVAAQTRLDADAKRESREKQIAQQRAESERQADQRKRELERQADANEQKVQRKAAKRKSTSRAVKAAQDKAVDGQARTAKSAALTAESRALSVAKDALAAEETVDVIDDTIEGTHAARTSS
jgi:hypothetical protein